RGRAALDAGSTAVHEPWPRSTRLSEPSGAAASTSTRLRSRTPSDSTSPALPTARAVTERVSGGRSPSATQASAPPVHERGPSSVEPSDGRGPPPPWQAASSSRRELRALGSGRLDLD